MVKGASVSATWTAEDAHAGLATPASGSIALDTGSVGQKTASAPAGTARDNVGHQSAAESCSYSVIYAFGGFFSPVDNSPVLNQATAGQSIPVRFSPGGNQGLAVFADGYPASQPVSCTTSAPVNDIEETVTAGGSALTYDASGDRYSYVWKTDKGWSGRCRQLTVRLVDGSGHTATFRFK